MIHNEILVHVRDALTDALITNVPTPETKAGVVKIGQLQGDPAPDKARITVTLYANDPDTIVKGGITGMRDGWDDKIDTVEIGTAIT